MCMYLCHPQILAMTLVVIFIEMAHYDPVLDSMFLIGQARVRIYIFFCRPFTVTILSPHFILEFLYDGIPLYMAHPIFDLPPPSPVLDIETDSSETSSPPTDTQSSGASTPHRGDQVVLELPSSDTGSAVVLENGFYSL